MRDHDRGRPRFTELALRQLRLTTQQPVESIQVRHRRYPGARADFSHECLDDDVHEILAAEPGVAGRCPDLHDPLEAVQQRDVECSAAKIEDEEERLVATDLNAVGQRGRRRLRQQP